MPLGLQAIQHASPQEYHHASNAILRLSQYPDPKELFLIENNQDIQMAITGKGRGEHEKIKAEAWAKANQECYIQRARECADVDVDK